MKYFTLYIILVLQLLAMSCKKFLEIDPPKDRLITKTVFENDETAIAALTSIYSRMNAESNYTLAYHLNFQFGLMADELKNYSAATEVVRIYTNSLDPQAVTTPNYWQIGYNFIYNANAVYESCLNSATLTSGVKKQLMAEALFIRAYWHFFLTNVFGDIPIILSTDYEQNRVLARSSRTSVLEQVIEDLVKARAEISEDYLSGNSVAPTTERIRPNKNVVTAFLARVYLYAEKFADAERESTVLIEQTEQYSLPPLSGAFLKNNSEAIWQLMTPSPSNFTMNTFEGLRFILTTKPSGVSAFNCSTLSESLLNSFEVGDNRKTEWIGVYTDQSVTPNVDYFYPAKYKSISTSLSTEYTTLLRLGEQFLIRAEARLQQNDFSGSADDLSFIRLRAGLLPTSANDMESLVEAIAHERRVELFAEYGHRWFDLQRTGEIDNVMSVSTPLKGGTWASYKRRFPIPLREIQSNPKLKQNDGYN